MRAKKTFTVSEFKKIVNEQLERTDEFADNKYKEGICLMWHKVANRTGQYNGYQYLYWHLQGYDEWVKAGQPEGIVKEDFIVGNLGEYARRYY